MFFFLADEYREVNSLEWTNSRVRSAPPVVGIAARGRSAGCTSPASIKTNQLCDVGALAASGIPGALEAAADLKQSLAPLTNPFLNKILTGENGLFNNPFRYHNTNLRFDAQPNASNAVNLRLQYSHDDSSAGNPDARGLVTRDLSILSTWNHTFTPSLLNSVLVQVVPKNVANNLPNPFQGVNFSLGTLNAGNLGGTSSFGSPSLVPYKADQRRYQFEDNLTWIRGAHTFKLGASMRLADYHVEDDLLVNK